MCPLVSRQSNHLNLTAIMVDVKIQQLTGERRGTYTKFVRTNNPFVYRRGTHLQTHPSEFHFDNMLAIREAAAGEEDFPTSHSAIQINRQSC